MTQIVRVLGVESVGAVAAVQDLLWRLMENDIVQALLVPLQTHAHEAPAPTLIKNRERLDKANPLAPVMTLNSAKIVRLLLSQQSGKRLAAVLRPCEARSLLQLANKSHTSLEDLVTVTVDCLGSHGEEDYEQRAALWGDIVPTRESLRWSRQGQVAPYRFRRACQICERPYFDGADIAIGLFGQNVNEKILVFMELSLAEWVGLGDNGWTRPAEDADLARRSKIIGKLSAQREDTRQRLLADIHERAAEIAKLLALFDSCTLCGECQEACPLTPVSGFDMDSFKENTPEYIAARLLDIVGRSQSCAGCGMCEAACHLGLPLLLVTQMISTRVHLRQEIIAAFGEKKQKLH